MRNDSGVIGAFGVFNSQNETIFEADDTPTTLDWKFVEYFSKFGKIGVFNSQNEIFCSS